MTIQEILGKVISSITGALSGLKTTAKDLVVNAINELYDGLFGQFLGTLYNVTSWSGVTDFTQFGSSTLTVTSNKIVVTGGTAKAISATLNTSNTTLPNVLKLTAYGGTALEKYKIALTAKVNAAPSATTNGFGVGTYSISAGGTSNCIGYFNMTTGTGTGTVSLLIGTTNNTAAISALALTFAQNDYILLTVERIGDRVIATAKNLTASGQPQVSCSYVWDFTSASNFLAPNTSNFAVANMAGTGNSFIIDTLTITSKETKNAPLMLVGDSKMQGYSTTFDTRLGAILDKKYYPGTIVHAGQGDRTADVLNRIAEIIALAPKQVFLYIGSNDLRNAVSSATWQANISSIVSQLQTAGISVVLSDGFYETNTSQTTYTTFVQANFSYVATIAAGSSALTLAADAIHPTFIGTLLIADLAFTSGLFVDYSKNSNGKSPYNSFNQAVNDLTVYGAIKQRPLSYTPDLINANDIAVNNGVALVAAFGTGAQKNRFLVQGASTTQMEFRNYFGHASSVATAFAWYSGYQTLGGQTLVLSVDNAAHVMILGAAPGPSTPVGSFITPNNGAFASCQSLTVGQDGGYIPRTTAGVSKFYNHEAAGKFEFYVSNGTAGAEQLALSVDASGRTLVPATNTATGTTGAQTINKNAGIVNFAAGASTLVVTNSLVQSTSLIFVQVLGTDATAISARVTRATGSFTITLNAAATAETAVEFWVIN